MACVFAIALAGSGCGAATLTNDEIIRALELTKPEDRNTYIVAGDPFCEIRRDLLGTEEEVVQARASKRKRRLVVTNRTRTAGVIAVPPFEGACKERVASGMRTVVTE